MYHNLLIVDLETNRWQKDRPQLPAQSNWSLVNEIIEIGAVLIDSESLEIKKKFQTFVKPRCHPILSEFCKNLTKIEQFQIDEAPDLAIAKMYFAHIFELYDKENEPIFCSWGKHDRDQLWSDCVEKYSLPYPFEENNHLDLKPILCNALNTRSRGLKRVLSKLDLKFEGQYYSAIDNAINTARVLKEIVNRTGLNIRDAQT